MNPTGIIDTNTLEYTTQKRHNHIHDTTGIGK